MTPTLIVNATANDTTFTGRVIVTVLGSTIGLLDQNGIIESYIVELSRPNGSVVDTSTLDVNNHSRGTHPADATAVFAPLATNTNYSVRVQVVSTSAENASVVFFSRFSEYIRVMTPATRECDHHHLSYDVKMQCWKIGWFHLTTILLFRARSIVRWSSPFEK